MAVVVSFMKPGVLGSANVIGMGTCRVSEVVTVPGTTTITAWDGEIAVVVSSEADVILAAHGSAPNAAATVATNETTAGYGVPASGPIPIAVGIGHKLDFKALA